MRAFTIIDVPQRSEAWFASRLGRLTGSVAGDMVAKTKTGWSASRMNLLNRLVLERLTNRPADDGYQSPAMLAGIEREPLARAAYEAITGELVQETGFLQHKTHMAGASLDGHVGDFAKLLSIKCRQPTAHLAFLRTGTIPADAQTQILHEMWITGAREADYFCWNPEFPPSMQSRLVTVRKTDAEVASYEAMALAFLAEVETELRSLLTMADIGTVAAEVVGA